MPLSTLVYGGCYEEYCLSPQHDTLGGSGLRGAQLLASLLPHNEIEYLTWTYKGSDTALQGIIREFGRLNIHPDSPKISECQIAKFRYQNPLFPPHLTFTPPALIKPIRLDHKYDTALVYGTLESRPQINAKKVVYDPQSPHNPTLFHDNGSYAESLAIVLNQTEARALSNHDCVYEARDFLCKHFLNPRNPLCEVIVIKLGHAGCWVCTSDDIFKIPAFQTTNVFSIGSGDIFSAAFFHEWALQSKTPEKAAQQASLITAMYCANGVMPRTSNLQEPHGFMPLQAAPIVASNISPKNIYLAGPFFNQSEIILIEFLRKELTTPWSTVFSPLHDVGLGDASEVYDKDIEGLEESDIVFAVLNGQDFGTIFELGYAVKAGKPIVCLAENTKDSDLTMAIGAKAKIFDNITSAVYHGLWETMK